MRNKGIVLNDIAGYLDYSRKPIREWENNKKSPDAKNLTRLAEAYEVKYWCNKELWFHWSKIDEVYYQMWIAEQYPYYLFQLPDRFVGAAYNLSVQNGINEW